MTYYYTQLLTYNICDFQGIEAALWSELIRTPGRMDSQLWPRLFGVSERSWHKAAWEQALESKSTGDPLRDNEAAKQDLAEFMTLIGSKELRRLEAAGVEYYLPRPGARWVLVAPVDHFTVYLPT